MELAAISVIGGFILSGITIICNVLMSYIGKRSDKQKEMNLKIIELAYREYEFRTNLTKELAEKDGVRMAIYPFDHYLLFYTKLAKLIEKGKFTEKDVTKLLGETKDFAEIYNNKNSI